MGIAGCTARTAAGTITVAVSIVAAGLGYAWARPGTERTSPACRLVAILMAGAVALVAAVSDVVGLDPVAAVPWPSWVCAVLLAYAVWVPASRPHHAVAAGLAAVYLVVGATAAHAFGLFGLYPEATTGSVLVAAMASAMPTWVSGVIALMIVEVRAADRRVYHEALRRLETLGGYILREKLGAGGMGEVWRADHAFLARPAAVKIIRPEVLYGLNGLDRKAVAKAQLALGRLEREAKATAQLTSTHTVRVYDFGRGPDTTFFFAMELLDGLDLQSLVSRFGPQPQERVRHILLQACDSLAEAHDRGMVHRDIKPANLFLCRMGKTLDHLKVLDFGLVRSDPTSKPDDVDTLPRLTRQGIISGSPSYMAPEQAEGSDHLDRRADIYALGCVAYFLLTGSPPFRGDNPMLVLMQQMNEPPQPMEDRCRRARIAPELNRIVERMLAKRREDRFESAEALASHLTAMTLPRVWDQDLAARWWARSEVPVVIEASYEGDDASERRLARKLR